MDNNNEQFIPELVDEQVDRLLADHASNSPDAAVVADLLHMYRDDEHTLQQVWLRLGLESGLPVGREEQPGGLRTVSTAREPSTSAKILDLERNRHMQPSHKHPLHRTFALAAAACIAALIVGSMLWVSSLARQNQGSHTAAHNTNTQQTHLHLPSGIYSSNQNGVFRLAGQTSQVLWQRPLKDVAKILPAANVVYILQSSQSAGGINAVVALDPDTGQTLWTHAFSLQRHGQDAIFAQTTDLALSLNQLYVGWQIWNTTANTTAGQIYVLNASNGSQRAVYPATAAVWSLAVGDGVLAVSADSSLQVYNPSTGKPLWHVSVKAPTNEPVVSLSIANGLIYAVITTNDQQVGTGQSYIAAYKASTGELIWKSPAFAGDALAHFTVDQHIVYFGTLVLNAQNKPFTGSIYAYDMQQNRQLWSRQIDGGVQTTPVVSNGMVYITADNGSHSQARVIALAATTGTVQWQQALADGFADTFCVSNGLVYIANVNYSAPSYTTTTPAPVDRLYALHANNGSKLWEISDILTPLIRPVPLLNVVPTE